VPESAWGKSPGLVPVINSEKPLNGYLGREFLDVVQVSALLEPHRVRHGCVIPLQGGLQLQGYGIDDRLADARIAKRNV